MGLGMVRPIRFSGWAPTVTTAAWPQCTLVMWSFPPEPRVQMMRCLEKRKHCLSPSFFRDREPSRPLVIFPFSLIGTWIREPVGSSQKYKYRQKRGGHEDIFNRKKRMNKWVKEWLLTNQLFLAPLLARTRLSKLIILRKLLKRLWEPKKHFNVCTGNNRLLGF